MTISGETWWSSHDETQRMMMMIQFSVTGRQSTAAVSNFLLSAFILGFPAANRISTNCDLTPLFPHFNECTWTLDWELVKYITFSTGRVIVSAGHTELKVHKLLIQYFNILD